LRLDVIHLGVLAKPQAVVVGRSLPEPRERLLDDSAHVGLRLVCVDLDMVALDLDRVADAGKLVR